MKAAEIVYHNNKIVRVEYLPHTEEAKKLFKIIEVSFPEYYKFTKISKKMSVGFYSAKIKPYSNQNISLYVWADIPENLKNKFNINYDEVLVKKFFGLKFNTETKKIILKTFYSDPKNLYKKPEIKNIIPFDKDSYGHYGEFFSDDNQSFEDFDFYFLSKPDNVKDFCRQHNLQFPIDNCEIYNKISLWGISFNKKDLIPKLIKGYYSFNADKQLNNIENKNVPFT